MESLFISNQKLSKEELATAVGGSVLVHAAIIALVLIGPWSAPKQTVKPPYCSVNLVSLQDAGGDAAPARKGTGVKNPEGVPDQTAEKAASSARTKPGPVVPVKRLQFDAPVKKAESELKKIEAPPVPSISESGMAAASVDKKVESLIPKTKTQPKASPLPQVANNAEESGTSNSRETARKQAAAASQGEQRAAGNEIAGRAGNPDGSVDGHPKGTADGRARGANPGPAGGSPDGVQNDSALRSYFATIQSRIRREWHLLPSLKAEQLEARVLVTVRQDGKVVDLQFEKRSGQPLFDQSVENAVRRADPLPPFPETFRVPRQEFGLRFRPEDLS